MSTRRADLGRRRWISRATDAALCYLAEGSTLEAAVVDAMSSVDLDADNGLAGGIGAATRRAAHEHWDAWTAEVTERVRVRMAGGARAVALGDVRIA